MSVLIFFFNDTATTEIYPLPLHAALPICDGGPPHRGAQGLRHRRAASHGGPHRSGHAARRVAPPGQRRRRRVRSEEHTSELQSPCNLVCRLLLEKKK